MSLLEPKNNCRFCKRLNNFLKIQRKKNREWHNSPVKGIGSIDSKFLIVGLAPGLKGANVTGIPFTGDYSGKLLISNLKKYSFLDQNEFFTSNMNLRITNVVKCVPPRNRPLAIEINNCRQYLISEIQNMKNLRIILSLGHVAHKSVLNIFNKKLKDYKFKHLAKHYLNNKILLVNSYHCSKYNINTKLLKIEEFEKVFIFIKNKLINF